MTCSELRQTFEDTHRIDTAVGAAAEHLVECAECARFADAWRELDAGLRLLRESAAQPSAALDGRVLENYRRHSETHPSVIRSLSGKQRLVICTGLAGMLVLAMLFPRHRQEKASDVRTAAPPTQTQPLLQSVMPGKNARIVDLHKAIHATSRHQRPALLPTSEMGAASAVAMGLALPDFRSLMYCDELSCGEPMQLIRVKVPSSATPFGSNANSPSGFVYADVLVGADGIARGIRVNE
jgi:hypothetical protein